MLKTWDTSNFRRTVGALCLLIGPLTVVVADFASTCGQADYSSAGLVATAAQCHDQLLVAHYASIVGYALFIVAVLTMLHVVRGRGVVLAHVAAIICVVSLVLQLAWVGVLIAIAEMGLPGVDRAAMVAFLDKASADPGAAPLALRDSVEAIGLFLFGIAIWRSRYGYRWAGPVLSVGALIYFLPFLRDTQAFIGEALLVIALAAIGYRILTTSDGWVPNPPLATSAPATAVVE